MPLDDRSREARPDTRLPSSDRLVAIVLVSAFSGAVLGGALLVYLMKSGVELSSFDPTPFVAMWAFILVSWVFGRFVQRERRLPSSRLSSSRSSSPPLDDASQAIRDSDRAEPR